jgi:hypothetical protein
MNNHCEYIHEIFNSIKRIKYPFDKNEIPTNGIYILFENGEFAHSTNRIVRIGTHTGDNNLPNRLREHFMKENKDRSIFRKNIGRAILNKNHDPFIVFWEFDLTARESRDKYIKAIDKEKQKDVENEVTEYIQNNFSFIIIQIDDKSIRLTLETKIISTISLCNECKPSEKWLGNYSPEEKIKKSGLWLVNGLWKTPLDGKDIKYLESKIG